MRSERVGAIEEHRRAWIGCFVAFVLCFSGAAFGAETSTVEGDGGVQVSLRLERPEGNSINDPMSFQLVVDNSTADRFTVEKITVTPPTAMRRVRGSGRQLQEPVGLDVYGSNQTYSLRPGSRNEYEIQLDGVRAKWTDAVSFFFLPGEYQLRYEVTLKDSGDNLLTIPGQARVELTPPLNAVLRGGVLGALLLTVFLGVYRLQHWLRRGDFSGLLRLGLVSSARLTLRFVVGSVVAFIVILLLNRSTDLPIPITVEVKDYMGGLVIGLFSHQLGDIVYEKLYASKLAPSPSEAAGAARG